MGMHKGLIGKSEGGGSVKPTYEDKTLGDYIARKTRQDAFDQVAQENKLTFIDWWQTEARNFSQLSTKDAMFIWQAAQENK